MIAKRIALLFLLASLAVSITLGVQHSYPQGRPILKADGGSPVPPVPPPPPTQQLTPILTADGGSPVPPIPPKSGLTVPVLRPELTLMADGGSPVPPIPPKSRLIAPILRSTLTLTADGGSPVPPVPPPPPSGLTVPMAMQGQTNA